VILGNKIDVYQDAGSSPVKEVNPPATANSFTVTGLTSGHAFTFTVTARNAVGWGVESAPSAPLAFLPPPAAPWAPTNVQAIGGPTTGSATVTWTAPYNGGSAIIRYLIRVYIGSSPTVVKGVYAGSGAAGATVTGLSSGHPYVFTVTAQNAVDWGAESDPSGVLTLPSPFPTVPAVPTNVQATAGLTAGSATVTWTAPYNGGSAISGYLINVYLGSGTTPLTSAYYDSPFTQGMSYTLMGLMATGSYTFTVTAENAVGYGPESAPSAAIVLLTAPAAPTGVHAVAGTSTGTVIVSWVVPFNGGAPISSYLILAYLGSGTTPVATGTAYPPATSFTFTGLTGAGPYTFTVRAGNVYGMSPESAPSAPLMLHGVPTAPANVQATPGTAAGTAIITWTAPNNGGSPILGYKILAYLGSGTTPVATAYPGASPTSYTMTGLTAGVSYTFTVTAVNALGWGPESARSSPIALFTAPGAPTSVQAVTDTTSVTVSWYAPTSNGGSPITGYVITASTGNTAETVTASAPGWALSTTLTQLVPGKTYTITVRAVNAIGPGPASLPASPVMLPTVPGAPLNLSASPNGSTLQVTWLAPAFNGGKPVTGYTATVSDGVHTPTSQQVTGTGVTFTNLPTGTTYTVSVTASNVVGTGPAANTSAALASLPPSLAVPAGTTAHHGDQVSFAVIATSPQPSDHLVLTATGLPSGVKFTDLGNGTGKVSGNAEVAAGLYPVTFSVSNGHNAPVLETTMVTVTRESAAVDPAATNPVNVAIAKTTGLSGTVMLRASLHEPYDPDGMADIGEAAPVTYTLTPLGGGQTYTFTANLNGGGIGGELKTAAVFRHLPTNIYRVTIGVGGSFYQGSAVTFLTVYNAAVHASVTGKGAVTAGSVPWTFQFHAAYGKGGKLSGTATFTEQPHLRVDVAYPLSTPLTLSTLKGIVGGQVVVKGHRAYFQGLATVNGVAGYRFVVTIVDNDYKSAPDLIGLQVVDPQHASVPALSFAPTVLSSGHAAFKR
jgi:titin